MNIDTMDPNTVERYRMYAGWIFAVLFFILALGSAYLLGEPNGMIVAPGVIVMVILSTVLILLSIYIFYVTSIEVER